MRPGSRRLPWRSRCVLAYTPRGPLLESPSTGGWRLPRSQPRLCTASRLRFRGLQSPQPASRHARPAGALPTFPETRRSLLILQGMADRRTRSITPWHPQHSLPDVGKHEVVRNRRYPVQPRFPEFPLHVVLGVEAVAAERVDAGVCGGPARFGREIFGEVGVRSAGKAGVEAGGGPLTDQIGRLDLGVGGGDRELDALVGADGAAEDDA